MQAATSKEVEAVLADATQLLNAEKPATIRVHEVDERLVKLLPEMDPFFIRWRHYMSARLTQLTGRAND